MTLLKLPAVWVKSLICALLLVLYYPAGASSAEDSSLIGRTQAARQQGNMDLADHLATQLFQSAQPQNNPALKADALYQQARNAMERNLYPQALALLDEAASLYKISENPKKLGHAHRQLGLTYRYLVNYPEALKQLNLSLQLFQQVGDPSSISSARSSLGVVLEKMGRYEEAIEEHHLALELNYKLGDKSGVASALYNLGHLRANLGDDQQALAYFQDALKLDKEAGNLKDIAYSEHKVGFMLLKLKNYPAAKQHIQEALKLFRQIQAPRDIDWALTTLARLEMLQDNLSEATEIIEGVISRSEQQGYLSLLVDAYLVAAELAYRQEKYDNAAHYITAGIAQAQQNQESSQEAELAAVGVKVFEQTGDIHQAFSMLSRQKQLEDNILNNERLKAVAQLQARTEFVRRAHQIELLEKEKALQQAIIEQDQLSRNLWTIVIIATLILSVSLYIRILQSRANHKLTQQVALRTRELSEKNTQLEQAFQQVEHISLTDPLTGLKNRRFLENQIQADLNHSVRLYQDWLNGKSHQPQQADIVVFVIDMDNFKAVNDTFGHNAGDNVLRQLATRLKSVFRESDYLVRWGGEEFVAVARFIARRDAPVLAQRLIEAVAGSPFELSAGHTEAQTCSIGFACYPASPKQSGYLSFDDLIGLADHCLYAAKSEGKNTWVGIDTVNSELPAQGPLTPAQFDALIENKKLILRRPFALAARKAETLPEVARADLQ
ncbi:GGDEF domain-containing protein [Alteromonas aestuariivivens]|uniref:diguanylate cyclase n=1 Tax=Alteromonas aestuariivivens TaxID=1938339 RepID=A0A3D8MDM5_9ALTE|nr:GGDEF domain-containing protein [Alteromonas aestuariivivens]RDV28949.1 GGDEF domain-containing protein [Alteromonas aestuariivivens]